jgi:tellurite resistance protein
LASRQASHGYDLDCHFENIQSHLKEEANLVARPPLPASFVGMVLGLSGLGQAWRIAVALWDMRSAIGEGLLLLSALVWAELLVAYVLQAIRYPEIVHSEFQHPVQSGTPALTVVSTLLIVLAVLPYSRSVA